MLFLYLELFNRNQKQIIMYYKDEESDYKQNKYKLNF